MGYSNNNGKKVVWGRTHFAKKEFRHELFFFLPPPVLSLLIGLTIRRRIPKEVAPGYGSVTKTDQVAPNKLTYHIVSYTLRYRLEALNSRAGHTRDILKLISVFMIACATSCGMRLRAYY